MFEICVRLLEKGQLDPYLGHTNDAQIKSCTDAGKLILARSREKDSTPKAVVEDRIRRWDGADDQRMD